MALGGVAWAAPASTPTEAPTKARGLLAALEDPNEDIVAGALLVLLVDDQLQQSSLEPALEQQVRAFTRGARVAELLRAKSSFVRGTMLEILERFGEVSPELAPLVLEQAQDSRSPVQAQAIRTLARVEGKAQLSPLLVGLLRDGHKESAQVAAKELQRLGALAGPRAAEIAQLLNHSKAPRAEVVRVLGALGDAGRPYAPEVTRLLEDPAADVRVAAMEALLQLGGASEERALVIIERLKDSSWDSREQAVKVLVQWADVARPHIPRILALTSHPDRDVRRSAMEALVGMKGMTREQAARFHQDPEHTIREAAIGALVSLEGMAGQRSQVIVGFLEGSNPSDRASAARALAQLGEKSQEYIPALSLLLKDPVDRVRGAAVLALASSGPAARKHIPDIIELLKDPEFGVREVVKAVLIGMKDLTPEHLSSIGAHLDEPMPAVREGALRVLQAVGPAAGPQAHRVAQRLTDENELVRVAALQALAAMGHAARNEASRLASLFLQDPAIRFDESIDQDARVAVALARMAPLELPVVAGLIAKASADPSRYWLWMACAHLVGGGDPRVERALRWLGRRAIQDQPREISIDEARLTLEAFAELWELSAKYPALREELSERIATVARLTRGQWSASDVALLQGHKKALQEFRPMHAETVQGSIDSIERWRMLKTFSWGWASHAGFWILLLFFYPRSPKVQAFFFWNPWVRNITGLGYVSLLLTWVPFLRRRLLVPFSRPLLADAELERFSAEAYFSRSEVLSSTGKRERLLEVLPRLQGQVVLEGASGLGKSMFLRYLLLHSKRLAVYLPAERCKNGVIEAIQAKLEGHARDSSFLQSIIYSGALDIYIDGLNEVTADTRARIVQFVERNFHGNILLTTQRIEWTPPATARLLVLQPLSEAEAAGFLSSREPAQGTKARRQGEAYRQACEDFVSRALSPELPEELRRAMREVLSNPMDLTVVAQLLADGHEPDLSHLRQQQYELMARDYAEVHLAEFPLKELAEEAYRMRREDRTIISEKPFDRELLRMEAFKLVVCRQWQGSDGQPHREWRFRHDKIQEFFIAQTFLADGNLRVLEHLGDPRFRGVYFLMAYLLPPEKARELRDLLVEYAAETRDHTVSDDFVKLLKAREGADKARASSQRGGASVLPLVQPR